MAIFGGVICSSSYYGRQFLLCIITEITESIVFIILVIISKHNFCRQFPARIAEYSREVLVICSPLQRSAARLSLPPKRLL